MSRRLRALIDSSSVPSPDPPRSADPSLVSFLHLHRLDNFTSNFTKNGVVLEDLPHIIDDTSLIETLIDLKIPRSRFVRVVKQKIQSEGIEGFRRNVMCQSLRVVRKPTSGGSRRGSGLSVSAVSGGMSTMSRIASPTSAPIRRRFKTVDFDALFREDDLENEAAAAEADDSAFGLGSLLQLQYSAKEIVIDPKLVRIKNRTIGRGAFGSVKLGTLLVGIAEIDVVVKEIAFHEDIGPEDVLRETELLHTLRNEHVVTCYGCFFDSDYTARVVLEFCRAGDLKKFIKRYPHRCTPEWKIDTLRQIAQGMQYIHSRGILHRDLKLENVLVSGDNHRMKICDFGSSKADENQTGSMVGTGFAVAPEVGTPKMKNPYLCDVYAFGILMWNLWTGLVPFSDTPGCEGLRGVTLMMSIRKRRFRPNLETLVDCPEELSQLMQDCWAEEPEARPSGFDAILARLEDL